MKVLDDCHSYFLQTFMHGDLPDAMVPLHFYEMREDGTKIDGVTNEEVLAVLIHRLEVLNMKMFCFENDMALSSLKGALSWLNARTEERTKRGVEGTHQA